MSDISNFSSNVQGNGEHLNAVRYLDQIPLPIMQGVSPKVLRSETLGGIGTLIRAGSAETRAVALVRADSTKFKAAKERLKGTSFAASRFQNDWRKDGNVAEYSNLMSLDFDHINPEAAIKLRNSIFESFSHVVMAFVSPSREGVKVILNVDTITSTEDHHQAYRVCRYLVENLDTIQGHKLNADSLPDPSRLCFLPHDPDCLERFDAPPLMWRLVDLPPEYESTESGESMTGGSEYASIHTLDDLCDTIKAIPGCADRHPQILPAVSSFLMRRCVDIEDEQAHDSIVNAVKSIRDDDPSVADREVDQIYRDCKAKLKDRFGDHYRNTRGTYNDPFPRLDAQTFSEAVARTGREFRFNLRANRVDVKQHGKWKHLTDRHEADIKLTIKEELWVGPKPTGAEDEKKPKPFEMGRVRWMEHMLQHLNRRECDPFHDWLKSRPAWDGVSRLSGVLYDVFGVDDTPLNRWASEQVFLGTVKRTIVPAFKLDTMVVLKGAQGIGKSAFAANLFPPSDRGLWFSDSLTFDGYAKEQVESTLGRAIVEVSEMQGAKSYRVSAQTKAFITRQYDSGVRMAYARNPEERPRRFLLVGTTDSDVFLANDPAGARRFCIVECRKGSHVEAYLDQWRDQLWAEAYHRISRDKEDPTLPFELRPLLEAQASKFQDRDEVLEDAIGELIAQGAIGHTPQNLRQIIEELQRLIPMIVPDKRWQGKVSDALKQLGWDKSKRRRMDDVNANWWTPPKADSTHVDELPF